MATTIKFTKMQGAGNDYIYVNTLRHPIADPVRTSIKWSSCHTGIGSDGLVLIGKSTKADFSMRIFNADGSEAMMCGNASRCIGKYVYDNKLTQKGSHHAGNALRNQDPKTAYGERAGRRSNSRHGSSPAYQLQTNKYPGRQNVGKNNHSRWKRIQRNICLYGKSTFSNFHR